MVTLKAKCNGTFRRFTLSSDNFIDLCDALRKSFSTEVADGPFSISYVDDEGDVCSIGSTEEFNMAIALSGKDGILKMTVTPGEKNAVVHETVSPAAAPAPPADDEAQTSTPRVVSSSEETPPFCGEDTVDPSALEALGKFLTHIVSGGQGSVEPEWLSDAIDRALEIYGGLAGVRASDYNCEVIVARLLQDPTIRNVASMFEVAALDSAPAPVMHPGIRCDGCDNYIVGVRYKCAMCPDFDLCEACEGIDHDQGHIFLKVCRPARIPVGRLLPVFPLVDASAPAAQPHEPVPMKAGLKAEKVAAEKAAADHKELAKKTKKEAAKMAKAAKQAEKAAKQAEKAARAQAAKAKKAMKQKAAEDAAAARREAERLEAERKEVERQEAERKEAERKEAERQEAERQEAERKAAMEAERKAAAAAELRAQKVAAEQAMAEQLREQKALQERKRAEAEAERERLAAEREQAAAMRALKGRFVEDVTMPDGVEMGPGTTFTKIWRLQNTGGHEWPEGSRLLFMGGDEMSCAPITPMPAVPAGATADVAVDLRAPDTTGRFCGYWRMRTPCGVHFGPRIWVDIVVATPREQEAVAAAPFAPSAPIPIPTPGPVSAPPTAPEDDGFEPIQYPVVTPEEELDEVSLATAQIMDMGFNDYDRIRILLNHHNNDVQEVVAALLR